MKDSIIPIIQELTRIYEELSVKLNLKYPKPIITIQSRGRSKTLLGWYSEKRWQENDKEVGEINICAEALKGNPTETLVHEMVHYGCSQDEINDCSNNGYHNKEFAERATLYGLNCTKDGRRGWSSTSIGDKLQTMLDEIKINKDIFKLYRKEKLVAVAPTKMKKYRCSCTTIRCATSLAAECKQCHKEFLLQE